MINNKTIEINIEPLDEGSIININGKTIACEDKLKQLISKVSHLINEEINVASLYYRKQKKITIKIEISKE